MLKWFLFTLIFSLQLLASPFVFETKQTPFYFDQFVYFSKNSYAVKLKSDFTQIQLPQEFNDLKKKIIAGHTWIFLNVTSDEIQNFLEQKNKFSRVNLFKQMIFPEAYASGLACSQDFATESASFLNEIQSHCSEHGILSKLQTCANDAFSKVGQNIIDDLKSVKDAVTHPIQFFTKLKDQMTGLGDFIRLLPETLKELKSIATGISEGILQMLACEAVGDLALPALKMIMGGAGSAAMALTIKNWMERLKGMKHMLSGLGRAEKAGKVNPKLMENLLKGGVRCEMAR